MSSTMLKVHGLAFAYPGAVARLFDGFGMEVDRGAVIAVRGPSGSGKSTLLFLLGLFIKPQAGTIMFEGICASRLDDGQRSKLRAHRIGFVLQDSAMHAVATVVENVAEGGIYTGLPYESAIRGARSLLDRFGIGEIADRRPTQISGGQAQRAALCRALLKEPSLILADEPTGNLDAENAAAVLRGLHDAAARGAAVVIVTHSSTVAGACDRTVELG